jgi:outer membrane protein assembly factor BamB
VLPTAATTSRVYVGLLAAAVMLVAIARAAAEDWPQFRGPDGQGHSSAKNLPVEWGPKKNVAWKQEIPGEGWSSPVVIGKRIYLTSAVAREGGSRDYSLRLLCLDADTGEVVWNEEVFPQAGDTSPRIHTKNSHASPTPVINQDRIYVHFAHQGTACFDLDGKPAWKNRDVKYEPVHGGGGSPAIAGGKLVYSVDGAENARIVALHCDSGKLAWQTPRGVKRLKTFAFATPLVIGVGGQSQIICPAAGMVGAYAPASGEEIWRVEYDGYSVIPRPVFGHGLVFISTSFDLPTVLAIRPDGSGNVTDTHVAWRLRRAAPHSASMLLVEDELYMVSDGGVATCVDAKTGKNHWQERLGGGFSASLLYGDGKIYFQNEEGAGTVIEAGKEFKQLAKNELGERTLASYAVVESDLLIRTDKHLYRIKR